MKGEFHNLRRQIGLKSAWLFVPALGAILSGAGVVANRAVDLTQLTDAVVRAESRAARCTELERRLAAFEAAGGVERVRAAARSTARVVVPFASTVEMHAAVRLACAEAGLELERLDVGEPATVSDEEGELDLERRDVELGGQGSFAALADAVRLLASRGYPARVTQGSFERTTPLGSRFEIHAVLAMFHGPRAEENSAEEGR